jgi:hypothetical protein
MDNNYARPGTDHRNAAGPGAPSAGEPGRQDCAVIGPLDRFGQADNSEGGLPPSLHQAVLRGQKCCARVPERIVSKKTASQYKETFVRMFASGSLIPWTLGLAYNTCYERRAALHFGAVDAIRKLIKRALGAFERQDYLAAADLMHKLHQLLDMVEPAFDEAPPGDPDVLPWERPPSRFYELADEKTLARGAKSKKYALANLASDWDRVVFKKAIELKFEHSLVLAVKMTVPVRTEDMVPGDRPSGYSDGVILRLLEPDRLEITVKPCKSHFGRYGTGSTTIIVDPTVADAPAKFLAKCCRDAGGRLVVSVKSKNAVRKAIRTLGKKALGADSETITPSVLRHQIISDFKVTFGAGKMVAAASGQLTDRTQSRYGRYQHGRARKGYVSISSARVPRTGNVARASGLSKAEVMHPHQ